MAIYRCISCNANLDIEPGDRMITCEFCGATQLIENTYPGENLVLRGYMFLEEGNFYKAKEFFESALNENAEAYDAYLGMTLVNNEIRSKEEFFKVENVSDMDAFLSSLKFSVEFKNAMRFAPSKERDRLTKYREQVYKYAYDMAVAHEEKKEYEAAIPLFKRVYEYADAAEHARQCESCMISNEFENKYLKAKEYLAKDMFENATSVFDELGSYKDSSELKNESEYMKAKKLISVEDYSDAVSVLGMILGYKDSENLIKECRNIIYERKYSYAKEMLENSGNISLVENAKSIFLELGGYKDSVDMVLACCNELVYIKANKCSNEFWNYSELNEAQELFESVLGYKNSKKLVNKCKALKILNVAVKILIGVAVLGVIRVMMGI